MTRSGIPTREELFGASLERNAGVGWAVSLTKERMAGLSDIGLDVWLESITSPRAMDAAAIGIHSIGM